jgi:cytochrome c oxidase assembly protein subunit 15
MQPSLAHLKPIQRWITFCAVLVAFMVLIGGLTRLTESGLSIVEWKLFSGIFPPMSTQSWQAEFARYQTSPEFKQVNSDFSLRDFQHIFWLEYIHRVLGRIIGLALLLPFAYFALRRQLTKPLAKRMAFACVLVALQGTVGWIMVASGLKDEPRVDALKLALHLSLALALFAHLLWTRWQLNATPRFATPPRPAAYLRFIALLTCIQIVFGALVAGLDAGYSYNSFPLMDGQWVPSGLHLLKPWWLNHLENIRTVQFQHRMLAYFIVIFSVVFVIRSWKHSVAPQRRWLRYLLASLALQFGLGVATLLSVMAIPLASAHQLGALLLLSILLRLMWLYPHDKCAN